MRTQAWPPRAATKGSATRTAAMRARPKADRGLSHLATVPSRPGRHCREKCVMPGPRLFAEQAGRAEHQHADQHDEGEDVR